MAAGLDVGCSSVTTSLPITTLTLRFPGGSLHTCLPIEQNGCIVCPLIHLPMDCDLVNKCVDLIHSLEGADATVHFIWIPSRGSIPLNEKQTTLLSVPYKMTQWTLALSTL
ncbi:hypothetical protein E2C01_100834 [Portunus trituberculatus]|uniref:Uncharacterized protein n=1 Tax=Portunus trituberculatus TaxID=210409 RepID=A0A5B7KEL4_PORTR|nr:hypothetical protein [Portunus trituberculatus]